MPKVTRYGGMSNAGLTERDGGFVDNTAATRNEAASFLGDGGDDSGQVEPDENEQEPLAVAGEAAEPEQPPFDPSKLSVADVNALLADCSDDERDLVLQAERADKNRKGITGE